MKVNKKWTLFLDRDGVINQRIPDDYVRSVEQFQFIEGSKKAIAKLSRKFGLVVVVTNQQGIGKGLMTEEDLSIIHEYMLKEVEAAGGIIHKIYHCPDLAQNNPLCRKPQTGMALQAKKDFPKIDFSKSVMVGDSISDMKFGKQMKMKTFFIVPPIVEDRSYASWSDYIGSNLEAFASVIRA